MIIIKFNLKNEYVFVALNFSNYLVS